MYNSIYESLTLIFTNLNQILHNLAYYAWSPLSIFLLLGTGVYLSFKFKFIQFRRAKLGFKLLIFGHEHTQDETLTHVVSEDIKQVIKPKTPKLTGFQAFATVLSGSIGTGNIAGVATAIVMGGPGALFWMWATGLFGMATKFCSCSLAHYYRQKDADNNIIGGPMITLSHGLGYNKLAKMFAGFMILSALSTGSMVQANSIADSAIFLIPNLADKKLIIGLVISLSSAIVILGGVKRIASFASIVVPFIALAYVATALSILIINYKQVPNTFSIIFQYAFSIKAVTGASFWLVIRSGVARGLFASEAGLGTAPIALANIDTKHSIEAGFIGMLGPMVDTLLICSMTGLIIIITGVYDVNNPDLVTGAPLSQKAFAAGFSFMGDMSGQLAAWVVGIGLTLFAYTTILTWSYYGDRCVSYLFGTKYILPYKILFLMVLTLGTMLKLEAVWDIADIANIGMAVPNLIAILCLRHKVVELIKQYKY